MEKYYIISIHDASLSQKDEIVERVVKLGPRVVYSDSLIALKSTMNANEIYRDICSVLGELAGFVVFEVKPEELNMFGAAEPNFWKFFKIETSEENGTENT